MHEQRDAQDDVRDTDDATLDRRRLLGRAGTVAAVAGVGVAGAVVVGTPAQAAPGDPVTLGSATNDAGTASTTISTNSATSATVSLANTSAPDAQGFAGPALQLQPNGDFPAGPAGSFGVSTQGVPYFVPQQDLADYVYTSGTSWTTFPITPTRAVDTRNAAGRTRILNPGNLDSTFRLKANTVISINLDDLFNGAIVLYGNLTVVTPATGGFATIFPGGAVRPVVSTINFSAGQVLANAFVVGVDVDATGAGSQNAVQIFSNAATHVLLDVTAVGIGAFNQILSGVTASLRSGRALTARAAAPQRVLPNQPKRAGQ